MYCGSAKHERDALHCSSYCFCYKTQWRLCSSTVAIRALPTKTMALKEYGRLCSLVATSIKLTSGAIQ